MKPFFVVVLALLVFLALGQLGINLYRNPVVALRWALAVMFFFTASAHFVGLRQDLIRMVPPFFPRPDLLVTITGWLEIAGALGLLVTPLLRWAALGLAGLLLAMFPANVYAARQGLTLGGQPVTPLGLRSVLQVVFLALVLVAGFAR